MAFSKPRQYAKTIAGTAAEYLIPGLARDIDEGRSSGRSIKLKRAIVHARIQRAKWRGDEEAAKKAINDWWKSDVGDHFYGEMAGQQRFQSMFMGPHHVIVEQLQEICRRNGYRHLVEIGCGDGLVLDYLSGNLPEIGDFTGLDISERIVEKNRASFAANAKTAFEYKNVLDWVEEAEKDDSILFSYGGVMEYLTEAELLAVYGRLNRSSNVAVALVEPLDEGFDPATETSSRFIGTEHVYYCHNYSDVLKRAGFQIGFEKYMQLGGWPWVAVLATQGASGQEGAANSG